MKKITLLLAAIVLIGLSWHLGAPNYPPPLPVKFFPQITASVKGVQSDRQPPVCKFNEQQPNNLGFGDKIFGNAYDLGLGVSQVVIQLQRVKDGAVYDGNTWQENMGSALPANINGNIFNFTVPVILEKDAQYIFRCQAQDSAGNVQTKWSELIVEGKDLKQSQLN